MKYKTIIIVGLSVLALIIGIKSFKNQDSSKNSQIKNSITSLFKAKQKPSKKLSELLKKGTKITIQIDKSDYQLLVFTADTLVKTFPVVLGGNPTDDKLMQGDQCTPEGNFKIVSKYPHKSWSKFIWINYPTPDSWRKHKKAKAEGRIPKNAKIGGEIGIHGVPKGSDLMIKTGVNWTLGCISLTNKDVNELYPFIDKNTDILIRK